MKCTFGFSQFLLVLSWITFSTSFDSLEECKRTDDGHVTRGSFTCCSTSPRELPLEASFDFKALWKKCAVEPEKRNEDPVISAWRVFRCIVFARLRRKPLLPSTFAEMMTSKYPVLIKTQIVSKMSEYLEKDMKFSVDADCEAKVPYPKVHLIRNLFYDTEQEICEGDDYDTKSGGKTSSSSPSTLAESLCEVCDRRREMYHRNGDCCSQVAIPFPFIYLPFRYGNEGRVDDCVNDVIDDVGLPADTSFAAHLKYLVRCYPSCEHYLSGNLKENDLWSGPKLLQSQSELRSVVDKMMPKYFSSRFKQEIGSYVQTNFRSAWQETKTFESTMSPSQRDLRNCDKGKLKNLLASCRAHRLIETVITLYLNNLCKEKYVLAGGNGGIRTTTHTPVIGSSEEDPDWGWDIRRGLHLNLTKGSRKTQPYSSWIH